MALKAESHASSRYIHGAAANPCSGYSHIMHLCTKSSCTHTWCSNFQQGASSPSHKWARPQALTVLTVPVTTSRMNTARSHLTLTALQEDSSPCHPSQNSTHQQGAAREQRLMTSPFPWPALVMEYSHAPSLSPGSLQPAHGMPLMTPCLVHSPAPRCAALCLPHTPACTGWPPSSAC